MIAKTVALDFHPLRPDLYQELHSRPFQVLPPQARVSHIAVLTTSEQRKSQFKHLQSLHRMLGQPWPEEVTCYEQTILAKLTNIAAKIEAFRAHSTFRFSATKAYHQLVLTRLEELREDEVSGHLTIGEFLTRRLTPAVKTCEAVSERLEDLSKRVDRTSDMMRTRVELAIQSQNQQLLSSMDRRSQIQLMMQHTVEGFSVVAITYYLIGLLKLALDSIYEAGIIFNKTLALGIAIPATLALVYLVVRLVHHHFMRMAKRQ